MEPVRMEPGVEGAGAMRAGSADAESAMHVTMEIAGVWDRTRKMIVGGPLDGTAAETAEEAESLIMDYHNGGKP